MLEALYHRGSHPTREERDNLAREAGMYAHNIFYVFTADVLPFLLFFFFAFSPGRPNI
jgi:hypothetical protein